jgi:hypothetical protein
VYRLYRSGIRPGGQERIAPAVNPATLASFDAFFCRTDLIWVELTAAVVELATDLRGQPSNWVMKR